MNQRGDSVLYGHSGVFIRHDPAEIRGVEGLRLDNFPEINFTTPVWYLIWYFIFALPRSDQERRLAGFLWQSSN